MKLAYPGFSFVLDTETDGINTVIIENQKLMLQFIKDIKGQVSGDDGKAVLSDDGKIVPISKRLEFLDLFVPFETNRKTLLSKAYAAAEKASVNPQNYERTMQALSELEKYLYDLMFETGLDMEIEVPSVMTILKACGAAFKEDGGSLCEDILNYCVNVNELEQNKLYVTYNLRSLVDTEELELFLKSVISHGVNLIMIENHEYEELQVEQRHIIDYDLCEIE